MKNQRERDERRNKKEEKENSTTASARARARVGVNQLFATLEQANDYRAALWCVTGIRLEEVFAAADKIGMSGADAVAWLKYMNEVDYCFKNGETINYRTFRRSLRMWHKTEARIAAPGWRKSCAEARQKAEERRAEEKRRRVESAAQRLESWELCNERCANFRGGACQCGVAIPPALQDPPRPPEECERFEEGRADV